MQDGANLCVLEVAGFEGGAKLTLVHVVRVLGASEVQELRAGKVGRWSEVVHQQDVALACLVALVNEVAADEAGAAGHDDHFCISSLCREFAVSFLMILVVEKPSTVGTISTRPPDAMASSCPPTVSMVESPPLQTTLAF